MFYFPLNKPKARFCFLLLFDCFSLHSLLTVNKTHFEHNTLLSHYRPKPGKSAVTDAVTNNSQWTLGQLLTSLLQSPPGSWTIFSIIEKWVILHSEVVIISSFNLTEKYLLSVLIVWSILSYKMWFCINVRIYFLHCFYLYTASCYYCSQDRLTNVK